MITVPVLLCLFLVSLSTGIRTRSDCAFGSRRLCQRSAPPTDVYYFGTQSLWCTVIKSGSLHLSSTRFPFSPYHRLIKYKDYVFEWGRNGYSIHFNQTLSYLCGVTWEEQPAGISSQTIGQADDFGRLYKYYNGEYGLFTNNCHMFANDLSRFLTNGSLPVPCDQQHEAALQEGPSCATVNVNSFRATYSHFKELRSIIRWTRTKCHQYKVDLLRFMDNYCGRMDSPFLLISTTSVAPTTSFNLMDLARRLAREREEMLRHLYS